jgi:radical SAM superfamily enzyme YgiQ (UPF0313 family)
MKIILAYLSGVSDRSDLYISLLPTGLCYLHACLREAGYDSVLINFSGWTPSRINRKLLEIKPDIVGISQWTHNRQASLDLASNCKRLFPDCTIVMGGGHATFCYEDLLTEGSPVDCVVIGEGEVTLLALVARAAGQTSWHDIDGIAFRRNGKVFVTAGRTLLSDLDQLPMPARYLEHSIGLDMELQPEFIVTARGCPSACHFCSSPAFWGRKVRFRSAQAIVDEIMYVREQYGTIYFSIRDDTFTADRKRTLEFCSVLIERKAHILWNCQSRVTAIDQELVIMMKRAGCECIQLGVESGSPRLLSQLGKNILPAQIEKAGTIIRDIGINLSIYLISAIPGETDEDLNLTIDLLRRIRPDDGYVSPLVYYPGTRMFNDAVTAGFTGKNIFAGNSNNTQFVSGNSGQTSGRLLKEIAANRSIETARFDKQKELLGFCYTTNVLAGELYRQMGNYRSAEIEFQEISDRQPDNPWGWFLLGELFSENGQAAKAAKCYSRVLEIVPLHGPSKAKLKTKKTGPFA